MLRLRVRLKLKGRRKIKLENKTKKNAQRVTKRRRSDKRNPKKEVNLGARALGVLKAQQLIEKHSNSPSNCALSNIL